MGKTSKLQEEVVAALKAIHDSPPEYTSEEAAVYDELELNTIYRALVHAYRLGIQAARRSTSQAGKTKKGKK